MIFATIFFISLSLLSIFVNGNIMIRIKRKKKKEKQIDLDGHVIIYIDRMTDRQTD